jgi:hypothetical protein
MDRALKGNIDGINSLREVPDRSIVSDIDRTYRQRKVSPIEAYED